MASNRQDVPHSNNNTAAADKPTRSTLALKNRHISCMTFFNSHVLALPALESNTHSTEIVKKKEKIHYLKHHAPGSLMPEIEASLAGIYHALAPECVPVKAYALFNEYDEPVAVSSQEIPNFLSLIKREAKESDLQNKNNRRRLAMILALSYVFKEDDLHRGNMSVDGFRFDFDMSLYDLTSYFKEMGIIDNAVKTNFDQFDIDPEDIDNFPDLKHARPRYWPTLPHPVMNYKKHAFNARENELFKTLKYYDDFKFEVFKMFLKIMMMPPEFYSQLIRQHVRDSSRHPDPQMQNRKLADIMSENIEARINELREVLVRMPSFQAFLWEHGKNVKAELLKEFSEYNQAVRDSESKKCFKDANRNAATRFELMVNTRDAANQYTAIFKSAENNACFPNAATQKRL